MGHGLASDNHAPGMECAYQGNNTCCFSFYFCENDGKACKKQEVDYDIMGYNACNRDIPD